MPSLRATLAELRAGPVRQRLTLGLAAGLGGALLALALGQLEFFRGVERRTVDARFRIERALEDRGRAAAPIAIVDVDNESLRLYQRELGRWPWPREVHAAVLDFLALASPRAVAFDFLFSEPDLQDAPGDTALASSTAALRRTFHSMVFDQPGASRARALRLERELLRRDDRLAALARFAFPRRLPAPEFATVDVPFTPLLQASTGVGAINLSADPDGISRREHLFYAYAGRTYPSLPLAIALGGPAGYPRLRLAGAELLLEGAPLPLDGARLWIHWRGGYADRPYPVYPVSRLIQSYVQLSQGEDPDLRPDTFAGKYVLVGSSATGLADIVPSPFGANEPGVMVHASLLDTLLSRDFLTPVDPALRAGLVVLGGLATGLAAAAIPSASWSVLAFTVLLALLSAGAVGAFLEGWILPWSSPGLASVAAFTAAQVGGYVTEGRRKRELKRAFSKFVPPEVAETISRDPAAFRQSADRREVTVLFSDIRGFTSLSEELPPEDVARSLNEYLSEMVRIVFRNGGTLDKYIGDAVMAFFGAPLPHPDHALAACRTALEMLDGLATLNRAWAAAGRPTFEIGIGINTGEVVVGFIGDYERRMDYTVIGDHVNLAARLESLNKEKGTRVLVSEFTRARADGKIHVAPLGEVQVRGKERPVSIYTLEGLADG